ncbi:unnamed protein product [Schistosoma mattheei]|uniref:Uncharacterized protein n=1 Tax=Schistosoma mattheei TaxID=31246 RepID=A0A3P7ZA12_9TREM|nr:unnamed protein product [Schistosoma mattheei]
MDIFGQVGFATAFDLNVPLKIKDGVIYIGEHTVNIDDDHFTVDFIKTQFDNPKINAIVVTKGSIEGNLFLCILFCYSLESIVILLNYLSVLSLLVLFLYSVTFSIYIMDLDFTRTFLVTPLSNISTK